MLVATPHLGNQNHAHSSSSPRSSGSIGFGSFIQETRRIVYEAHLRRVSSIRASLLARFIIPTIRLSQSPIKIELLLRLSFSQALLGREISKSYTIVARDDMDVDNARYEKILSLIDEAHAQDPNKITVNGSEHPYELHYSRKMSSYLSKRDPSAPAPLRLAIRAQHFRRWEVPRDSYPMTKPGYHAWRTYLKKRQADLASQICLDCGYSEEEAGRVASLIRKEDLKKDEETQTLEDVACLVFLDDQFEEFEKLHDEEKMVGILKKTWGKMSERGHELALEIPMSDRCKELVGKALAGG